MNIPGNTLVLVADGRKAMILRNTGDAKFPNLRNEWAVVDQNPPTAAQGTDRPGRVNFQGRRSSVEQTDWHTAAETAFAKRAAGTLEDLASETRTRHIVLVAPPRTLAVLRECLGDAARKLVIGELHQDLVNLPVQAIETHILRAEAAA